MPDSAVQVNNSFGKIVLKSYDSEQDSNADFNDTASFLNGITSPTNLDDEFNFSNDSPLYQNNELSFLSNNLYSNIDTSQVFTNKNRYASNANNFQSKYNNSEFNTANTSNFQSKYNDFNATNASQASIQHRRSSSLNKGISSLRYGNLSSSSASRNYASNDTSSSSSIGMRASSNYLEQNRLSNNYNDSKETNYLPESYKELKSVSNSKLVVEEEEEPVANNNSNENTNEETLAPIKPFVPAKTLLMNQQSQNKPVVSINQTNSNPQIKEIKVMHKTPANRFSSSGETTTSSSSNSSKESTPFSTTPSTPLASSNTSISALASASATSFTSSSQQQNTNLQKSFKQQILSQGPKLVNF